MTDRTPDQAGNNTQDTGQRPVIPPRDVTGLAGADLMRSMFTHKIDAEELTSAQIGPLLPKRDARGLRLTKIFTVTAQILKDDIKDHPWKLFFYILPFPPGGAMAVGAGTALLIALGITKKARQHRQKAVAAFREAIDYTAYAQFMNIARETAKEPRDHIAVDWAYLRQNLMYRGKVELFNMGLEWSASLPDNFLSRAFNRGLERQIISTRASYIPREYKHKQDTPSL